MPTFSSLSAGRKRWRPHDGPADWDSAVLNAPQKPVEERTNGSYPRTTLTGRSSPHRPTAGGRRAVPVDLYLAGENSEETPFDTLSIPNNRLQHNLKVEKVETGTDIGML
jgi:hypothetical protein